MDGGKMLLDYPPIRPFYIAHRITIDGYAIMQAQGVRLIPCYNARERVKTGDVYTIP
jgi:hypothetical protein